MATITREIDLQVEDCISCGVTHALPRVMYNEYSRTGGYWCCPNGHRQGWDAKNAKTEADKLREQVARLQSSLEYEKNRVESAKRQASAIKGQMTKLENRVKNGVCPCCKRSFANLHRHIASKHPDFAEQEAA